MKDSMGFPVTETEQKFWTSVKGYVFSDTAGVVVMGVAVFIGWVVMFF